MMKEIDDRLLLLFDMDGVILSEEGYLRSVALTMHSFIAQFFSHTHNHKSSLSGHESIDNLQAVEVLRQTIFPDKLMNAMRMKALNSNWDKAYAGTVLLGLCARDHRFSENIGDMLYDQFQTLSGTGQELVMRLRDMESKLCLYPISEYPTQLFEEVKRRFQQFYLGTIKTDNLFLQDGMIAHETLLCNHDALIQCFRSLRDKDIVLGIGTGRPRSEVIKPLNSFGLLEFFDENRICTFDDIVDYEQQYGLPAYSLAKPHPHTYASIAFSYRAHQVVVIGDSPADLLAAQAAGFHFVGIGPNREAFQAKLTEDFIVIPEATEISAILEQFRHKTC